MDAWEALQESEFRLSAEKLISYSDHIGFRVLSLFPAAMEAAIWGKGNAPRFSAGVLALFGAGSVAMLWLLVRRVERDETTATWAAFFYAAAVTPFFLSRHFFPYEPAIFFMLFGWWVAVGGDGQLRLVVAGMLVGWGYETYNAYWNLGGVVLAAATLYQWSGWRRGAKRALFLACGLVVPIVTFYLWAVAIDRDPLKDLVEFSRTVTQGDLGRLWFTMPEYFLFAEGWFFVVVIAVILGAALHAARERQKIAGLYWLLAGAALATEMLVLSDVLPRFALAGRMIKPVFLFLATGAGVIVATWVKNRPRARGCVAACLVVAAATPNFWRAISIQFPSDFQRDAIRLSQQREESGFSGNMELRYTHFFHRPVFLPPAGPHTVLLQRPHPLQYRPYQYEGYTESMRAEFRANEFPMSLLLMAPTKRDDWQSRHLPWFQNEATAPGVIELLLHWPDQRQSSGVEPLVVAGYPGRADLFGVEYLDNHRIRFVLDHWGVGMVRTDIVDLSNRVTPTRLRISMGALLPPPEDAFFENYPELTILTERLVVEVDGRTLGVYASPAYPTSINAVRFGQNFIGGTTMATNFKGEILAIRRLDLRECVKSSWGVNWHSVAVINHEGRPGPLAATIDWSNESKDDFTLFAAADTQGSVVVSASRVADGWLFQVERDGKIVAVAPRPWAGEAKRYRFEITLPELLPPALGESAASSYLETWTRRASVLRINGKEIFRDFTPRGAGKFSGDELQNEHVHWAWADNWPSGDARRPTFPGAVRAVEQAGSQAQIFATGGPIGGWPFDNEGRWRFRIRFSKTVPTGIEPLMTVGRPGVGDGVLLVFGTDGTVRVAHDHWGWQLATSTPAVVLPATWHELEIRVTKSDEAGDLRSGATTVVWDGKEILRADRPFYSISSSETVIGRNLIGLSNCKFEFSGEIEIIP